MVKAATIIGCIAAVLLPATLAIGQYPANYQQQQYNQNYNKQIYQTVPVPAYSFQYLPAVASYGTPVVPPIEQIIPPQKEDHHSKESIKLMMKEAFTEMMAEMQLPPNIMTNQAGQTASDGMPVAKRFGESALNPSRIDLPAQQRPVTQQPTKDLTPYALVILHAKCSRCHTEPGRGEIFLFKKSGAYNPNVTVREIVESVVTNRMPRGAKEDPQLRLPRQEVQVLQAWLEQQTQGGTQ